MERKNSTFEKMDRLNRLVKQTRIALDEMDRLKRSIKKDLTNLKNNGMLEAMEAGYKLYKAARNGELLITIDTLTD